MRFHEKRNFLDLLDKDASFSREELAKENRIMNIMSTMDTFTLSNNIKNPSKSLKRVFIDGVCTKLFVSPSGKIITDAKTNIHRNVNDKGYFFLKRKSYYSGKTVSKKVHHIVVESFLIPKGDNIKTYSISFKDKDVKNCSIDNIVVKKRGSMGVAIKKEVAVYKDNQLVDIFDSISRCAEALSIPRRRISDYLKGNKLQGGLSFIYN